MALLEKMGCCSRRGERGQYVRVEGGQEGRSEGDLLSAMPRASPTGLYKC